MIPAARARSCAPSPRPRTSAAVDSSAARPSYALLRRSTPGRGPRSPTSSMSSSSSGTKFARGAGFHSLAFLGSRFCSRLGSHYKLAFPQGSGRCGDSAWVQENLRGVLRGVHELRRRAVRQPAQRSLPLQRLLRRLPHVSVLPWRSVHNPALDWSISPLRNLQLPVRARPHLRDCL